MQGVLGNLFAGLTIILTKPTFRDAGILIPFPQREVRIVAAA